MLYEAYRPRTWSDVVGQDKAIGQLESLRSRGGLAGRAYWVSGQSGTGKTTLARLIAAECAEPFCIDELDAGSVTVSMLQETERRIAYRPIAGNGWAVLINEAHALRRDAIRQLLVTLERIPERAVWVFTTTSDNQESLFEDNLDAHPLLSRCIPLALARRDLARPFAERAMAIAQAEGLDGQPIEAYIKLMQKHRNNLRSAIQDIEAGAMVKAGASC